MIESDYDQVRREKLQEFLDWLTPVDYSKQQNDYISQRQTGTGQWLLQSSEFQEWLKKRQRTLFCPGIPGAGKTILIWNELGHDPTFGIAYIYVNYRRPYEHQPVDIVLSLLKQLFQNLAPIWDSAKKVFRDHEVKQSRPSISEVTGALQSVLQAYSGTFILIDALDEYQVPHHRQQLLSVIFGLQSTTGLRLFATSRSIPDIEKYFTARESMILEIRAQDEDIQTYIKGYLPQVPSLHRYSDLTGDIEAAIVKSVDGM